MIIHEERIVEVPEVRYVDAITEVSGPQVQYVDKAVPRFVTEAHEVIIEKTMRPLLEEMPVAVPQVQNVEALREEVVNYWHQQVKEVPKVNMEYRERLIEMRQTGWDHDRSTPSLGVHRLPSAAMPAPVVHSPPPMHFRQSQPHHQTVVHSVPAVHHRIGANAGSVAATAGRTPRPPNSSDIEARFGGGSSSYRGQSQDVLISSVASLDRDRSFSPARPSRPAPGSYRSGSPQRGSCTSSGYVPTGSNVTFGGSLVQGSMGHSSPSHLSAVPPTRLPPTASPALAARTGPPMGTMHFGSGAHLPPTAMMAPGQHRGATLPPSGTLNASGIAAALPPQGTMGPGSFQGLPPQGTMGPGSFQGLPPQGTMGPGSFQGLPPQRTMGPGSFQGSPPFGSVRR